MYRLILGLLLGLLALSGCAPRAYTPDPATAPTVTTPVLAAALPAPTPTPVIPPTPAPAPAANPYDSVGCGATPPGVPLASITLNGVERSFITHIPATYDPTIASPLIFAFHGRTNTNAQARAYFGIEAALPEAIVVYPSGIWQGGGFTYADAGDPPGALRDYALVDEILRLTRQYYCVDSRQVYAVGHSLGAWFATSLACARAGTVRAVVALAGGMAVSNCPTGVAAMILHNPNDRLVPVAQGYKARDTLVALNGAVTSPQAAENDSLRALRCERYAHALNPVMWCPHDINYSYNGNYYPHTWPNEMGSAIATFFHMLN